MRRSILQSLAAFGKFGKVVLDGGVDIGDFRVADLDHAMYSPQHRQAGLQLSLLYYGLW
jgi:hypothetical protein